MTPTLETDAAVSDAAVSDAAVSDAVVAGAAEVVSDEAARVAFERVLVANAGGVGSWDRERLEALVADAATVQAVAEAARLAATSRLDGLANPTGDDTEATVARKGRCTTRAARQARRRAGVTNAFPALAAALATGTISGEHVDAVDRALACLEPGERPLLHAADGWVTGLATRMSPDELWKVLRRHVAGLSGDGGVGRFERQRAGTSLRTWTDPVTGMTCLYAEYDPERGTQLTGRLSHTVEALFHDAIPDGCPSDERKHGYLRALGLLHLTGTAGTGTRGGAGGGAGVGRVVEMIVVIDHDTLRDGIHEHSRIELPDGLDLPVETLRRLACDAEIIPVVLGTDGVVLDVGRAARLATVHQRRALRAMYPTCAVHGCDAPFDHCVPHHLRPWHHGGSTDLANLLPLCSKHHHAAHEGGWQLRLDPATRMLTITRPDGTSTDHPPPNGRTT